MCLIQPLKSGLLRLLLGGCLKNTSPLRETKTLEFFYFLINQSLHESNHLMKGPGGIKVFHGSRLAPLTTVAAPEMGTDWQGEVIFIQPEFGVQYF